MAERSAAWTRLTWTTGCLTRNLQTEPPCSDGFRCPALHQATNAEVRVKQLLLCRPQRSAARSTCSAARTRPGGRQQTCSCWTWPTAAGASQRCQARRHRHALRIQPVLWAAGTPLALADHSATAGLLVRALAKAQQAADSRPVRAGHGRLQLERRRGVRPDATGTLCAYSLCCGRQVHPLLLLITQPLPGY